MRAGEASCWRSPAAERGGTAAHGRADLPTSACLLSSCLLIFEQISAFLVWNDLGAVEDRPVAGTNQGTPPAIAESRNRFRRRDDTPNQKHCVAS
jgi:hypothetical protein